MKLTSGKLTIPVERDGQPTGEISFDPQDVAFASGFYALMEGLEAREKEYAALANAPLKQRLAAMESLCDWLWQQVEATFGHGSPQVLFGEHRSPELFRQFFVEVEPHIRAARSQRLEAYRKTGDSGVMA